MRAERPAWSNERLHFARSSRGRRAREPWLLRGEHLADYTARMKLVANVVTAGLALSLLCLASCATVSKEEFERTYRPVRATTGDAPHGCRELGSFEANGGYQGFGRAKEILRYKVGKAGGDLVVMDVADGRGGASIISGTGYRCAPVAKSDAPAKQDKAAKSDPSAKK